MANKSPSIILRELDKSAYAVTSSNTVLAVVGYATKGLIGVPTLVTSRTEFLEQFGPPSTTAPWSSLAVYRAFLQGNQVLFYRVAEESGSNEAVAAEYVILNDRAVSAGYQEFTPTVSIASGSFTVAEVYDFKVAIDGGTIRDVYIASPASGDWTLADLATAINTQITAATSGFQEFEGNTAPSVPAAETEYRIQASVDASDLAVTGATSTEFSVFLNPGDTITEIAADLTVAFAAGTRGYTLFDVDGSVTPFVNSATITGLSVSTTYDFNVNTDTLGAVDCQVTTGSVLPTWTEFAALCEAEINTQTVGGSVTVRAYGPDGFISFQSALTGTSSACVVVDDTIATGGTVLFATINASGTLTDTETGSAGTVASGNYAVSVNANTGRVRLTSDSTGTSSAVAITAPAVFGNNLGILLTSILTVNTGEAVVAATAAVNATSGAVRITSDSTGGSSTVAITEGDGTDNEHIVALIGTESAVVGLIAIGAETTDNVLFRAKEKGSSTNNISVIKTSRTNPVSGSTEYDIEVLYDSDSKETFTNVSLDEDDATFFVTVINSTADNGGSAWIEVEYEDNVVDTVITFPNGTYTLGSGDDAYQAADNLGDYDFRLGTDGIPTSGGASLFVAALASSGDLGNTELYNYHILITPDNGSEETQNAAVTLAEYRKDFFYITDPPFGLTYTQVADWHNGSGGFGRSAALNTSYSATYWPWLKDYNSVAGEYVWSPPSVFVAEKYIEIDRKFGPWYAVAGDTRGKIIGASDIESSPSFAQREVLYGDLNAINPIVNFVAKGIEIYGQKTLLRATTALNRVNVRRMVIYVKKLIQNAMEGIVFEPHLPESWARATNLINSILEPVRQANGLDDYRVSIDSTTNTADLIAQNIMKGIISLVPVGTIEIIDLTINILSPGATIS